MAEDRAQLELGMAALRRRRTSAVLILAIGGVAWLVVGYVIGAVIASRVGFVPDITQTITPLMLVPLTVALWAHGSTHRRLRV